VPGHPHFSGSHTDIDLQTLVTRHTFGTPGKG
jgi:hypothetical protein